MRLVWYRRSKRYKSRKRFLPAILLIGLLCYFYYRSIPPVTAILESQAQQLLSETEHQIVTQVLAEQGERIGSISLVERKENGNISGVEVNTAVVNQIRNEIILRMDRELEGYAKNGYGIPIGTLLGSIWTAERGPKVKFRLSSANQSDSTVTSTLTSAGYNQTLHRITLEINLRAYAVLPGYRQPVDFHNEFVLAETVIVGAVPLYATRTID